MPLVDHTLCALPQASRVDKLQSELSSQREKLEEASRLHVRMRETKNKIEATLEAKAMLEDEVESLQEKVGVVGKSDTVSQYTLRTSPLPIILR